MNQDQVKYLIDNYKTQGNKALAINLNTTVDSVRYNLKKHNLQRGPAQLLKMKKQNNAGHFKLGHKPFGTKYNGYTRTTKDGYLEVRISEGVFKLQHHVNWQLQNGPIPKGHVLQCIDGNKTNTHHSNWKPTTNSKLILQNANRPKQSKSLKEKWTLQFNLSQLGIKKGFYAPKTKQINL